MKTARTRVVMLVKNSFEYDARVRKEASSLIAAGWDVTVVAIHVPGVTAQREGLPDGIEVVRVPRLYGRLARLGGPSTLAPGVSAVQTLGRASREAVHGQSTSPRRQTRQRRLLSRTVRAVAPALRAANSATVDARMSAAVFAAGPAVVHAHDLNTLVAGRRAATRARARLVYDAHELHRARNGMGPLRRMRNGLLEGRLVRHCDLVITATDTWADMLAQEYGIARPLVIRNLPQLEADPQTRDLRSALELPAEARILLYQGSIQRGRGIEPTIRALPLLPGCHLVVIGYGAHRPFLERLAGELEVAARVHFPGPVDNHELLAWTRSADVGTCLIERTSLSYYTSLPNKLFEYMHAGIPVLASDFPDMGGVVRRTGCGTVCNPVSPTDIARATQRLLREPGPYRAAALRASLEHHWTGEAESITEAYRRFGPVPDTMTSTLTQR